MPTSTLRLFPLNQISDARLCCMRDRWEGSKVGEPKKYLNLTNHFLQEHLSSSCFSFRRWNTLSATPPLPRLSFGQGFYINSKFGGSKLNLMTTLWRISYRHRPLTHVEPASWISQVLLVCPPGGQTCVPGRHQVCALVAIGLGVQPFVGQR